MDEETGQVLEVRTCPICLERVSLAIREMLSQGDLFTGYPLTGENRHENLRGSRGGTPETPAPRRDSGDSSLPF